MLKMYVFIFARCCVDGVLIMRGALAARVSVFAVALRFGVFESVPTVSRGVPGVGFLGGECSNI